MSDYDAKQPPEEQSAPSKIDVTTYHKLLGRLINDATFRADLVSGDVAKIRSRLAEVGVSNPSADMIEGWQGIDAKTLENLAKAFDAADEIVAN